MSALRGGSPRTDLRWFAWVLDQRSITGRKRCCAKCRRGTAAHGDLPCGYLGQCPNGCHTASEARS